MKQKVLTDIELRARCSGGVAALSVDRDTVLTPAAQDYLREHNINLVYTEPSAKCGKMTVDTACMSGGARYRDAETGEEIADKGEFMTHLRGNLLVPKTHPRIFLRGKIDCLMAQLIGVQLVAREEGKNKLVDELEDLLGNLRLILAAEVKDAPLESRRMLGMDSDEIRRVSHNVKEHIGIDHPIPNCRMGRSSIALNRLRTQVREVELAAAQAFAGERGGCSREDILRALNRLSSCVYILFCRDVAGRYNGRA